MHRFPAPKPSGTPDGGFSARGSPSSGGALTVSRWKRATPRRGPSKYRTAFETPPLLNSTARHIGRFTLETPNLSDPSAPHDSHDPSWKVGSTLGTSHSRAHARDVHTSGTKGKGLTVPRRAVPHPATMNIIQPFAQHRMQQNNSSSVVHLFVLLRPLDSVGVGVARRL